MPAAVRDVDFVGGLELRDAALRDSAWILKVRRAAFRGYVTTSDFERQLLVVVTAYPVWE